MTEELIVCVCDERVCVCVIRGDVCLMKHGLCVCVCVYRAFVCSVAQHSGGSARLGEEKAKAQHRIQHAAGEYCRVRGPSVRWGK